MSSDLPPPDPAFRRSLFLLLVVIGLLAASSFFYARDARDGEMQAMRQRAALAAQVDQLLKNQSEIIKQSQANEDRAKRFEKLLGDFLANSSDPVIARTIQETRERAAQSSTPAPRRTASTERTAAPRNTTRPQPRPSSSPRPTPKPTPRPLLPTLPLCTSVICITK